MNYNKPKKNVVREFIVGFFSKRMKATSQLITLETQEWLFQKEMPNQKLKVYQNDVFEFLKMHKW